ncbi:MAG TPA: SurA N-terminal domain-containing protein [Syntrophales bacterium]|nr:SurA N-terminal domain-containing protein [Syntrophales bacterium]HOL58724.1 SurA N-terminal domain-containing protein [Syntrophales bacterium]HPO34988.1 SurA N-terminal domain-containing protein [Syntrophales bacterium]
MLNLMRKHARNWMMKVLLGIIIVVFVLYFGSMGGRHRAEAIVSIDGKIITQAEFNRQYQDLIDMYRQRFGGLLSEEMIRSMNLKEQVLNKMIYDTLLMKKAEEMKIKVSDEELRKSIASIPAFQRNGVFDEALYQRMLRLNKIKPEEFEDMQRKNLTAAKLEELILDGIHVTEAEIKEYYQSRNAKVNLLKCQIPASEFARHIKPDRPALETYFKAHEGEFRVPTRVQVRYMPFYASCYTDKVVVEKDEINDYRLRVKEKVAEERIVAEIKKSKGMQIAYGEAKKAHDEIYQMENFEAYAAKHNLKIKTTDFFDENNLPSELKGIRDLAKIVFSLPPKEISRVLSTDDGYVILQVVARKEAHSPPFATVEQEVRKRYLEEEAKKQAFQEAEAIIARMKKGETLENIVRGKNLPLSETGLFVVTSPPSNLGSATDVYSVLSRLSPQNRVVEKPIPSGNGYLVLQLKDWIPPTDQELAQKKATIRETLLQMKKAEAMRFWIEALKTTMVREGRIKYMKEVKEL